MDGGHQARVCLAQLLALPEVPVAQMLEGFDYHSPIGIFSGKILTPNLHLMPECEWWNSAPRHSTV